VVVLFMMNLAKSSAVRVDEGRLRRREFWKACYSSHFSSRDISKEGIEEELIMGSFDLRHFLSAPLSLELCSQRLSGDRGGGVG